MTTSTMNLHVGNFKNYVADVIKIYKLYISLGVELIVRVRNITQHS